MTRRKTAEQEVSTLAFTDCLKELPNRLRLEKELQDFLDRGTAEATCGALLWIDLGVTKLNFAPTKASSLSTSSSPNLSSMWPSFIALRTSIKPRTF